MATILKASRREFRENPRKIDNFRIFTDLSREQLGVEPENLQFDLRRLDPGQYSAPYHFHRYAEELFVILSGEATLRTAEGMTVLGAGDMAFFEKGETGAHQLYNHTHGACTYLDIRTYIGYDVCEYPDSDKILLAPSFEIFDRKAQPGYFDGEEDVQSKWQQAAEQGK